MFLSEENRAFTSQGVSPAKVAKLDSASIPTRKSHIYYTKVPPPRDSGYCCSVVFFLGH